ncbi:hypothetical protein JRO89_XS14G0144800 [Xanthoceras sorbifolium]|uniref:RRM domain-containing protein n=1 Tax=Xanthoceras sorbifolium TaxID=99658 RepID=A0ABQ8H5B2_9ROSI|nr:hypothetical protein JRO89_XS14G0144800 [Xanthoceras sorbifolium]
MREQKVNLCLDWLPVGSFFAESDKVNKMAAPYESSLFSSSLSELFSRKLRLSSNITPYGHSVDTVASHFEEEAPFESLEELEAQTIGNLLPNDDDLFSGVTDGLDYAVQPTSGDDMDELDFFSSVGGMDLEDDGSTAHKRSEISGGLSNGELGICDGTLVGEHPHGEHPSRTLFVRNINSNVEDSELKDLFEQYGDIRTLYTACKHRGFVMISYYDIRAARNAMKALQNKPMRRRKLDIHYSIPKDNPSEKDVNQGTIVVFNLDSSVSNEELHQIFGVYGEIKEIRETPHRSHHKFIEFYDIRAAEAAIRALNKSDIAGKRIKLEPSRPGGSRRCLVQQFSSELEQDDCGTCLQQSSPSNKSMNDFSGAVAHRTISSSSLDNGTVSGTHSAIQASFPESPFHQGISSSVPKSLPSLLRMESFGTQSGLAESGPLQGQLKFDFQNAQTFHPHSLPEYHDGLANAVNCNSPGCVAANVNIKPPEIFDSRQFTRVSSNGCSIGFNDGVFGSAGSGSSSLPGHHYTWSNSYRPQPSGMMWPNSPSMLGIGNAFSPARLPGLPRAPSHMVNTVLPIGNHHVGSAPTVDPSLWDRRHAYAAESPEASGFHPGSLGSMRVSSNSLHSMDFVSHNIFPHVGGNCMDVPIPSKNVGFQTHHQRSMMLAGRSQMIPMMNSFDPPNERARSRRNEGGVNQADKKLYELDVDRILRGEDNRTTLMIKNIPNNSWMQICIGILQRCFWLQLMTAIKEHMTLYICLLTLRQVHLCLEKRPLICEWEMRNKCNVGYAFINMTDPNQIIPFYQSFNGKKWEKFNSEKVASLAYGRIQGKAALIAHFQNSSLMNEDKRCRPILFNTNGPNAGDQVPFPMGVNVRTRPGKARTINHEENNHGSPPNFANGEDPSNRDSFSGSKSD